MAHSIDIRRRERLEGSTSTVSRGAPLGRIGDRERSSRCHFLMEGKICLSGHLGRCRALRTPAGVAL